MRGRDELVAEFLRLWRRYRHNVTYGYGVRIVVEDACEIIDELDKVDGYDLP